MFAGCVSKERRNELQTAVNEISAKLPGQELEISPIVLYVGGKKSNILQVQYVSATNPSKFEELFSQNGTLYKEFTVIIKVIGSTYKGEYDQIEITALPKNYTGSDSMTYPLDKKKVQEVLATPDGQLIKYAAAEYYK